MPVVTINDNMQQVREKQQEESRSPEEELRLGNIKTLLDNASLPGCFILPMKLELWAFTDASIVERRRTLELVRHFLSHIVELADLYRAFMTNTSGKIAGPNGIANQVKITKQAVNARLKKFGLSRSDFSMPVTLSDLIQKSPTLRQQQSDLEDLEKEFQI